MQCPSSSSENGSAARTGKGDINGGANGNANGWHRQSNGHSHGHVTSSGSKKGRKSKVVTMLPPPLANQQAVGTQMALANSHSPLPTKPQPDVEPLSNTARWSFGVGHVLNDLVASCWFSYVLVFFRAVLLFSAPYAGLLLLIGQVADGCATPVVGYLSDKTNAPSAKLNPLLPVDSPLQPKPRIRIGRKVWIGVGSLIVALTFPPIFHRDILGLCEDCHVAKVVYFSFFIILVQFAWASVQVSHLALVPDLTRVDSEKVYLNSLRSMFTILSNVAVFFLAWLILNQSSQPNLSENKHSSTTSSSSSSSSSPSAMDSMSLSDKDAPAFFLLSLIVVGIGLISTLIFLVGTPEPAPRIRRHGEPTFKWYSWFKELGFYQTATIYTCTRLLVNVSQTYMPLYLLISLNAPKTSIATIPLTVFGAGLISTMCCERLTRKVGTRWLTIAGCAITLGACGAIYLIKEHSYFTYGIAVLIGCGTGVVGVSALSLICNLVGDRCESSAFVYGSMSFTDKIANGVAIMVAEYLSPHPSDPNFTTFYRNVMIWVPGTAALVAILVLLTIIARTGSGERAGYEVIACHEEEVEEICSKARQSRFKSGGTEISYGSINKQKSASFDIHDLDTSSTANHQPDMSDLP